MYPVSIYALFYDKLSTGEINNYRKPPLEVAPTILATFSHM